MKKILCAVDFSTTSLNALYFANFIASSYEGAELHLLTVQHDQMDSGVYSDKVFNLVEQKKYDRALENFQQIAEELIGKKVVHYQEVLLTDEKVSKIINRKAESGNFDLVVMGTEGLNNLKKHILGSTTKNVLKSLNCHLLAVPGNASYHQIEKLALGMDLMYFNATQFELVYQLTEILGNHLSIFDINIANNPLMEDKMKEVADMYAHLPNVSFHLVDAIEVVDGIIKFSKSHEPDMLVVISKKYTFLQKLFERSYTEKLVLHSAVPVLVLKLI